MIFTCDIICYMYQVANVIPRCCCWFLTWRYIDITLTNPRHSPWNENRIYWSKSNSWIYFYIVLNKNWKVYRSKQSFTGLGPEDRCPSWGLLINILFLICFAQNGLLITSHISGSAFDAILLWEIHSHKTNQQ